jgi:hypothetical protein
MSFQFPLEILTSGEALAFRPTPCEKFGLLVNDQEFLLPLAAQS